MKKIYVIGAGVNGLTSAVKIAEHLKNLNVQVKVIADQKASDAGRLWGPYLIGSGSDEKIAQWSRDSFKFFHHLWISGLAEEAGISMIPVYRLSTENTIEDPIWKDIVIGFEYLSPDEIERLSQEYSKNYKSGCKFVSFYCDPIKFIPYLIKRFLKAGGVIEKQNFNSFDDITDADLIINCSGMMNCESSNKIIQPIRETIMKVSAPWIYDVSLDECIDGSHVISSCGEIVLDDIHQVNDYSVKLSGSDDILTKSDQKAKFPVAFRDYVDQRSGSQDLKNLKILYQKGKPVIVHNARYCECGITLCWGFENEILQKAIQILKLVHKL